MSKQVQEQIENRRRQWAQLTPQQQMQRVQYALLDFQDYAVWRRMEARRRQAARLHAQPVAMEYERV